MGSGHGRSCGLHRNHTTPTLIHSPLPPHPWIPAPHCSINAPRSPKQVAPNCTAPANFPIQVDEAARTVTGAGVGLGGSLGLGHCCVLPCRTLLPQMRSSHIPLVLCAVAAGVPQRMLLDYLADYRHCKQAAGWTLPAFTWWTDQVQSVEQNWTGPHMRHDQTPAICHRA